MVSTVLQQGDCNAPATYQALMNHLFGEFIGRWMDVYLDDIIIYSDSLSEHMDHVRTILKILEREKLYLSEGKLQFLCKELKILGRVVDDEGIRMDPAKVDKILAWKTPTNRDALRSFLGAVGFLADDIHKVRVPMGTLSKVTGDTVPFRWDYTQQRAFDEVKCYVANCARHSRVPLDYRQEADPIWLMSDASGKGVACVIAQGQDWKTARIAAFYSAKLSPAQQNYPVHEQEMLAGLEGMMRHRDILQGAKFIWLTDHKGLVHLLDQRDLSGRQARWVEKLGDFDFEIRYLPGVENILPDALSRMYSYDALGMVRAPSEFTQHDEEARVAKGRPLTHIITMPVLVGAEACAMDPPRHSLRLGGWGRDLDPEQKGRGRGRPASASKDQRGVTQTPADHGETMPPPAGEAEIAPARQRNRRLKRDDWKPRPSLRNGWLVVSSLKDPRNERRGGRQDRILSYILAPPARAKSLSWPCRTIILLRLN